MSKVMPYRDARTEIVFSGERYDQLRPAPTQSFSSLVIVSDHAPAVTGCRSPGEPEVDSGVPGAGAGAGAGARDPGTAGAIDRNSAALQRRVPLSQRVRR